MPSVVGFSPTGMLGVKTGVTYGVALLDMAAGPKLYGCGDGAIT